MVNPALLRPAGTRQLSGWHGFTGFTAPDINNASHVFHAGFGIAGTVRAAVSTSEMKWRIFATLPVRLERKIAPNEHFADTNRSFP
jgi:hypothetical protein